MRAVFVLVADPPGADVIPSVFSATGGNGCLELGISWLKWDKEVPSLQEKASPRGMENNLAE